MFTPIFEIKVYVNDLQISVDFKMWALINERSPCGVVASGVTCNTEGNPGLPTNYKNKKKTSLAFFRKALATHRICITSGFAKLMHCGHLRRIGYGT